MISFNSVYSKALPISATIIHFLACFKCFESKVQTNFNGLNTDGSFTTDISNSFLSPSEEIPQLQTSSCLG